MRDLFPTGTYLSMVDVVLDILKSKRPEDNGNDSRQIVNDTARDMVLLPSSYLSDINQQSVQ